MNLLHDAQMSQLPPFDALIAFETPARLGGMTRAADELGLTQSAISHRIRRLEEFMGTQLLLRQNGGIIPTPAGSALLDALKDILDSAADLRSRCLAGAAPNRLRVGALARSMLVADALAERRLVHVLPPEMDQLSQKVHVVRWPGRLAGDRRVEAFASWLCAKASTADSSATISARSLRAPA